MIPRVKSSPHLSVPWGVTLLLLIVAALPVIVAKIPGLADLPNHIARHHVLFTIGQGGPLDRYFEVHWRWIGNLGVDLPVLALMHWMDAETATRIVVACIAPLTVIALLMLSRVAHGGVSASAMLAMPLVFHHAYMYGFVNYCLSIALAFIVLALWLRNPPESWRGWLFYGLASIGVWTAHLGGWSILAIAAGFAELSRLRSPRDLGRGVSRLWPLALPLLPLLLWRGESGGAPLFIFTEQNLFIAKALNFATVLKGWWREPDLLISSLIGILAILAFVWAGKRRLSPELFAAGTGVTLMSALMPTTVLGSWGADFRLAPAGVILLLLSISPARDPRREKLLFISGMVLFLVRSVGIAISWHRASAILEQRLTMLELVPEGSRMGFIAASSACRYPWTLDPDRKIPGYAITRRNAFTNTMFKVDGADLMTIRQPKDRAIWHDLSEDVDAICPEGKVDYAAVNQRVADMARDDFGTIWIWGVSAEPIALPTGYHVRKISGDDVLIGR